MTEFDRGFLSREVAALLYGIRPAGRRGDAGRLVTDNLAFRRDVFRRFAFEHASFGTVVDSLLFQRLTRAGYRVRLCDGLRMVTATPAACAGDCRGSFFARGRWAISWSGPASSCATFAAAR